MILGDFLLLLGANIFALGFIVFYVISALFVWSKATRLAASVALGALTACHQLLLDYGMTIGNEVPTFVLTITTFLQHLLLLLTPLAIVIVIAIVGSAVGSWLLKHITPRGKDASGMPFLIFFPRTTRRYENNQYQRELKVKLGQLKRQHAHDIIAASTAQSFADANPSSRRAAFDAASMAATRDAGAKELDNVQAALEYAQARASEFEKGWSKTAYDWSQATINAPTDKMAQTKANQKPLKLLTDEELTSGGNFSAAQSGAASAVNQARSPAERAADVARYAHAAAHVARAQGRNPVPNFNDPFGTSGAKLTAAPSQDGIQYYELSLGNQQSELDELPENNFGGYAVNRDRSLETEYVSYNDGTGKPRMHVRNANAEHELAKSLHLWRNARATKAAAEAAAALEEAAGQEATGRRAVADAAADAAADAVELTAQNAARARSVEQQSEQVLQDAANDLVSAILRERNDAIQEAKTGTKAENSDSNGLSVTAAAQSVINFAKAAVHAAEAAAYQKALNVQASSALTAAPVVVTRPHGEVLELDERVISNKQLNYGLGVHTGAGASSKTTFTVNTPDQSYERFNIDWGGMSSNDNASPDQASGDSAPAHLGGFALTRDDVDQYRDSTFTKLFSKNKNTQETEASWLSNAVNFTKEFFGGSKAAQQAHDEAYARKQRQLAVTSTVRTSRASESANAEVAEQRAASDAAYAAEQAAEQAERKAIDAAVLEAKVATIRAERKVIDATAREAVRVAVHAAAMAQDQAEHNEVRAAARDAINAAVRDAADLYDPSEWGDDNKVEATAISIDANAGLAGSDFGGEEPDPDKEPKERKRNEQRNASTLHRSASTLHRSASTLHRSAKSAASYTELSHDAPSDPRSDGPSGYIDAQGHSVPISELIHGDNEGNVALGSYEEQQMHAESALNINASETEIKPLNDAKSFYVHQMQRIHTRLMIHMRSFLKHMVRYLGIIMAAFISLYAANCTINVLTTPKLTEVVVPLDVPVAFDGIKILHMSDLHISPMTPRSWITDLVLKITMAKPDLIIITGDIADGKFELMKDKLHPLMMLNAPLGIYVVPGCHEYAYSFNEYMSFYRNNGFTVLLNQQWHLNYMGHLFTILGFADERAMNYGLLLPSPYDVHPFPDSSFNLLLTHQPRNVERYRQIGSNGIDLILAGNTHGGQVSFIGDMVKQSNGGYLQGLYQLGQNQQLYVNGGTGSEPSLPIRIGTEAEITMLTVHSLQRSFAGALSHSAFKTQQPSTIEEDPVGTNSGFTPDYSIFFSLLKQPAPN